MVHCAVYGCKNYSGGDRKSLKDQISFYSFPRNTKFCKQWVDKCFRKDKIDVKSEAICSLHFRDEDFQRNLKNELVPSYCKTKKLVEGAIPTLCLPVSIAVPKINYEREERMLKKERNPPTTITSEILKDLPDPVQFNEEEEEQLQQDGMQNIAGYVAYRLRHEEVLGTLTLDPSNKTWIDKLSEGGLYKPSEAFLRSVHKLEEAFNQYNGNTLNCKENYINGLLDLSRDIEGSDKMKRLFFRCKMYFRMKTMNKKLTDSSSSKDICDAKTFAYSQTKQSSKRKLVEKGTSTKKAKRRKLVT